MDDLEDDDLKLELQGEELERYNELNRTRREIIQEYKAQYDFYSKRVLDILLSHKNKYYDDWVIDTKSAIIDAAFEGIPPEVFSRIANLEYDYAYKLYKATCERYGLDVPKRIENNLSKEVMNRIRSKYENVI